MDHQVLFFLFDSEVKVQNRIHKLLGLSMVGLIFIIVACSGASEGTGPENLLKNVTVSYVLSTGCSELDTPPDSVRMGVIEFKNNMDIPVVPVKIAINLIGSSNATAGVKMYDFGASYRYADNSIIPNLDAQQDFENSYITFDVLPAIEPGGSFKATVKGFVPNPEPALYVFRMIPDSVKAQTMTGKNVEIVIGLNEFNLRIVPEC